MNSVVLIGRWTKDVELSYTQDQLAVASCTLAVDRPKKKGEESGADFIRIKMFGKTAENTEKFTGKGSKVAIEGRIQTGSYKNKNGDTVYTTDVVAHNVEFLQPKQRTIDEPAPHDSFYELDEEIPF